MSRVGGRGGESLLSPELQRQAIERVCQREQLELVDVLEELDKSGGDANRPLWNRAPRSTALRKSRIRLKLPLLPPRKNGLASSKNDSPCVANRKGR